MTDWCSEKGSFEIEREIRFRAGESNCVVDREALVGYDVLRILLLEIRQWNTLFILLLVALVILVILPS